MSGIPQSIRKKVISRAASRCEYCHLPTTGQIAPFPIDHIRPRIENGETELENLALSCPPCNAHKWAFQFGRDPISGESHPLFNPRKENWEKHFQWAVDKSLKIEGKTAIGRATIERLKMNHDQALKIRRFLVELGIGSF